MNFNSEKEQKKILEALQIRLNQAILEQATPETLATLSSAVRSAAAALKDLQHG
jgi:hypothetical protein